MIFCRFLLWSRDEGKNHVKFYGKGNFYYNYSGVALPATGPLALQNRKRESVRTEDFKSAIADFRKIGEQSVAYPIH